MYLMSNKNFKNYWIILLIGSIIGLVSSLIQTIERISYAVKPEVALQCDINAVFSCSNVFDAWQSSFFGFSNSLLILAFFGILTGISLTGVSGSKINKKLRLIFQFFALFFLAFGTWYLWQSTFVIGYLCIFCSFNYLAVVIVNWALLRINGDDIFKSSSSNAKWKKFQQSGADTFLWILWTMLVAGVITLHFA